MSALGYQKAQLTKAAKANRLRKKIAEVEQANLVMESPTFEPGKDYELVKNHTRLLSNLFSLISRAASSLRSQREKAEEFARQNPDERGEFPLLQEISGHWDASEMDDLLDEANTLLDRLDTEIKLLPNADMLYDRYVSSIASMPAVPNPTLSPASSNTLQPSVPTQQLAQDPDADLETHPLSERDRPSDRSSVAPAVHALSASDSAVPPQPEQCSQLPSGSGIPSGNPSTAPILSANPYPPGIPITLPYPNPTNPPSSLVPYSPTLEQSFTIPAYDIPAFHGDIAKFPAFWTMFKKAVHNNTSVPVSFKFMYLQSRMKGEAAEIIADFEPNEDDYAEAVRIIESTYSRPELLRNRLWEKLKHQAPARDSATSQRTTLCSIRATWAQMKRLNEESRSISVLKTIRSKFPRHTCEKVGELKKKGDPMWTVDELLVALDEVIDQQETIEDTVPEYYSACNSDSAVRQSSLSPCRYPSEQPNRSSYDQSFCPTCSRSLHSPPGYHSVRSRSPISYYSRCSTRSTTSPPQHQEYLCVFCEREGHRPENCFQIRSIKYRRAIVKGSGLCWLCLNQGHQCRFCSAPTCGYCGGAHHPALCFDRPRASYHRPSTITYRPISPRRFQFDEEVCTCRRAQHSSRIPSPKVSNPRLPSSSRRQQRSPGTRHTRSILRASSAPPVSQTSNCTLASQPTRPEASAELHDGHQTQLGPHSPSLCVVTCEKVSATQTPRLMVAHALSHNYRSAKDEQVTVLLDSGSQYSFIRTSLAHHLGLKCSDTRTIATVIFGGHQRSEESSRIMLTLWDKFDNPIELQLWTRDVIIMVPRTNNSDDVKDDNPDERVEVDVLIGMDNYWRVVDLHSNERLPSGLVLSHTRFGPVLSGSIYPPSHNPASTMTAHARATL